MPTTTAPNTFLHRLVGAAVLDTATYEEVETDKSPTIQADATVILSSVAAGIDARGLGVHTLSTVGFANGRNRSSSRNTTPPHD
jgi:hypothetical protein